MIPQNDFLLATKISQTLQDYFDLNKGRGTLRSTDAYEILVKKKIVEKDRHNGIKFRSFLNHLKLHNQLYLIPQCRAEDTCGKSTNWYFQSASAKTQKGRNLIPMADAVHENTLDESKIIEIVNSFPKRDTGKFTHIELETRATYPRAYEIWSKEEEELLRRVANEIKNSMKLSKLFQRQPSAIKTRLQNNFNITI